MTGNNWPADGTQPRNVGTPVDEADAGTDMDTTRNRSERPKRHAKLAGRARLIEREPALRRPRKHYGGDVPPPLLVAVEPITFPSRQYYL